MVSKLETKAVQLFCQCAHHWSMFSSSLRFNNITNKITSKFIYFSTSINVQVVISNYISINYNRIWFEYFRTGGIHTLKQTNIQHI